MKLSKWQIVKNSIKNDLPVIQESKKLSMAEVVEAVTAKLKKEMDTDHLDTTLPQLNITGERHTTENKDVMHLEHDNHSHDEKRSKGRLKSALKKSHSSSSFKEEEKDNDHRTLRKTMSFTDFQIISEVSKKVPYQEMWVSGTFLCIYMSVCMHLRIEQELTNLLFSSNFNSFLKVYSPQSET